MTYKNGREVKLGDGVIGLDYQGYPLAGMVVKVIPDAKRNNIQIVPVRGITPGYCSDDFLHLDDALAMEPAQQILTLPPHQQRVLNEKAELDERIARLETFLRENPVFPTLPEPERSRLVAQHDVMGRYSEILGERIEAFPAAAA